MARPLVTDALWERIEPLLPPPKRRGRRFPGRKPADRRKVLVGIIFVLRTGIPWEEVPAEMGVCGMTCWNYLRAWQAAGVWQRLHEVMFLGMVKCREDSCHRAFARDWGSPRHVPFQPEVHVSVFKLRNR